MHGTPPSESSSPADPAGRAAPDAAPPTAPHDVAPDAEPRISSLPAASLTALHRALRRLPDTFLNWPGGRWPVPTVTSLLLIALLVVAAVELLPKGWSDTTLTVTARTEVVELELDPQRRYVWWLPPGAYSLLTAEGNRGCEARNDFDVACSYTEPTALTIANGATVRIEVVQPQANAGTRFAVSLTPRGAGAEHGEASRFEIRTLDDAPLVATHELMTFESALVDDWRIPLTLKRVQIGDFLTESIAATGALGLASQPILTQGDVRIFARSFGTGERYLVQEERFDPADVVQIPADAPKSANDARRQGLLLGLLALGIEDGQAAFDVTLHTELAEVFVRRLGAEHRIGVSMWKIVSQLPEWLALWVVWVSLIVVANYYSDRLGEIRGHRHDTQRP